MKHIKNAELIIEISLHNKKYLRLLNMIKECTMKGFD